MPYINLVQKLLALISKVFSVQAKVVLKEIQQQPQTLTLALKSIHWSHGGTMQPKAFRRSFSQVLRALIRGDATPWIYMDKCDSERCEYGREHGTIDRYPYRWRP